MKKKLSLYDRVARSIESGQPGIWIRTHEPQEALLTLVQLTKDYSPNWELCFWDCIKGLQEAGKPNAILGEDEQPGVADNPHGIKRKESNEPESAMSAVMALLKTAEARKTRDLHDAVTKEDKKHLILVISNGHEEFVSNGQKKKALITAVQHLMETGKAYACHLIVQSFPGVSLPLELKEGFRIFDHELPSYEERKQIILEILESDPEQYLKPTKGHLDNLVKATGGLTRIQVEAICAEAIMDALTESEEDVKVTIDEHFIFNEKADIMDEGGLIDLDRNWKNKFESFTYKDSDGDEIFVPGLVGLTGLKNYCLGLLDKERKRRKGKKPPRGVLVMGIPGTGKSAFAKSLGNETGRAKLSLDVGKLMGGLVGDTEALTRQAFEIIDAMAPCVLFIDELEKAFAGARSSNDSGVGQRQFGSFLKWMNDHMSDVFLVATANDVSGLPPELLRPGRFNAKFFLGMPTKAQRDAIWSVHIAANELDPDQERPDDQMWTGAEIEQCCSDADDLGLTLLEASKYVVPTWHTSKEHMQALIRWADHRAVCAETGEVFSIEKKTASGSGTVSRTVRKVKRTKKKKPDSE